MWLSQLIAIDERTILLKYGKNFTTTFLDLLKRDKNLRVRYNNLIKSECKEKELNKIISYLLSKYHSILKSNDIIPDKKDKAQYLADVIQFLCATDA
jgi:dTDP-4-dehydrorhamnose reductase